MKALMSIRAGGPESLQLIDVPMPEPGAGELRVRIMACSINYPDALILEDKYQLKPERPFAPGGEVAGIVDAVGPGVEGWAPGDRLIAITFYGGLAEYAVVAATNAYQLPADMPFAEGAALLITYGTTIHALVDRGEIAPGETLLVLGAAGGTGVAAIEIGKALGARVVAAVSSEEKAEAVRRLGADSAMIYGRGPFDKDGSKALSAAFKAAVGPNGADVIYDPVGGDYAEPALRAIAWEGRYLVIGFPAGIPKLPLNLPLLKGCDIRGVLWAGLMARDPKRVSEHVEQLFRWWSEGKIRPSIQRRFPLERGGEAIAWLSGRNAIGKIVVEVAAD
ncbi:MAG: NADPH:quinone reductase [Alphaproteobacteria bacterium]|nr:NADPH:quinone reductase [Alphaproteobacteria bacterium]